MINILFRKFVPYVLSRRLTRDISYLRHSRTVERCSRRSTRCLHFLYFSRFAMRFFHSSSRRDFPRLSETSKASGENEATFFKRRNKKKEEKKGKQKETLDMIGNGRNATRIIINIDTAARDSIFLRLSIPSRAERNVRRRSRETRSVMKMIPPGVGAISN